MKESCCFAQKGLDKPAQLTGLKIDPCCNADKIRGRGNITERLLEEPEMLLPSRASPPVVCQPVVKSTLPIVPSLQFLARLYEYFPDMTWYNCVLTRI